MGHIFLADRKLLPNSSRLSRMFSDSGITTAILVVF